MTGDHLFQGFDNNNIEQMVNLSNTTSNTSEKAFQKNVLPLNCDVCEEPLNGRSYCKACDFEYPADYESYNSDQMRDFEKTIRKHYRNWLEKENNAKISLMMSQFKKEMDSKLASVQQKEVEQQVQTYSSDQPRRRTITTIADFEKAIEDKVETLSVLPGEYPIGQQLIIDYPLSITGLKETPVFKSLVEKAITYTGKGQLHLANIAFNTDSPDKLMTFIEVNNGDVDIQGCTFENATYSKETLSEGFSSALVFNNNVKGIVKANQFKNNFNAIKVVGSSEVLIENNTIENLGRGILILENSKAHIKNNKIFNGTSALRIENQAQPTIEENDLFQAEFGLQVFDNASPIIKNNKIRENTKNGIVIGNETQPTIEQNLILKNKMWGIVVAHNAKPTILSNILERNESNAIKLDGNSEAIVKQNLIQNSMNGIFIESKAKSQIEENTIQGCSDIAIQVIGSAVPMIKSNLIHHNLKTAIQSTSDQTIQIENNTIQYNAGHAIKLEGTATATISDNQIRFNHKEAIDIEYKLPPIQQPEITTTNYTENEKTEENQQDNSVETSSSELENVESTQNQIEIKKSLIQNNLIEQHSVGIQVKECANIDLKNNKIFYNLIGIKLNHKAKIDMLNNEIQFQMTNGVEAYDNVTINAQENIIALNQANGLKLADEVSGNLANNQFKMNHEHAILNHSSGELIIDKNNNNLIYNKLDDNVLSLGLNYCLLSQMNHFAVVTSTVSVQTEVVQVYSPDLVVHQTEAEDESNQQLESQVEESFEVKEEISVTVEESIESHEETPVVEEHSETEITLPESNPISSWATQDDSEQSMNHHVDENNNNDYDHSGSTADEEDNSDYSNDYNSNYSYQADQNIDNSFVNPQPEEAHIEEITETQDDEILSSPIDELYDGSLNQVDSIELNSPIQKLMIDEENQAVFAGLDDGSIVKINLNNVSDQLSIDEEDRLDNGIKGLHLINSEKLFAHDENSYKIYKINHKTNAITKDHEDSYSNITTSAVLPNGEIILAIVENRKGSLHILDNEDFYAKLTMDQIAEHQINVILPISNQKVIIAEGRSVKLIDLKQQQIINSIDFNFEIKSIAKHPWLQEILVAGYNSEFFAVNYIDFTKKVIFEESGNWSNVSYSRDGAFAVTIDSENSKLMIKNIDLGTNPTEYDSIHDFTSCEMAVSKQSDFVITGGGDNQVLIYKLQQK